MPDPFSGDSHELPNHQTFEPTLDDVDKALAHERALRDEPTVLGPSRQDRIDKLLELRAKLSRDASPKNQIQPSEES